LRKWSTHIYRRTATDQLKQEFQVERARPQTDKHHHNEEEAHLLRIDAIAAFHSYGPHFASAIALTAP
jgi:hypothetical protein